jgi:outer membrane protein assembly factor BamB
MIFATDPGLTMFEPRPGTYDRMTGIQRNVTVPVHAITLPEGGTYYPATGFMTGITGNTLFASAGSIADAPFHVGYDLMGGQEIWAKDRTNDASSWIVHSATGQGVYAQWDTNNLDWVGYNAATGQKLWVSDPEVYPFGSYQANSIGGVIADGMLYSGGMDGYEHAIDITTGKEVWKFSSGFTAETAYNTYPMGTGPSSVAE